MPAPYSVRVLTRVDVALMRGLNAMFAAAFEDPDNYASAPPSDAYLQDWLTNPTHLAVVALDGDRVIGGLTAYVLHKAEQARAEVYLYDLAVDEAYRRQGIATAVIGQLQRVAAARGATVVFVQADLTDPPAIALYEKLGSREAVLHFDLPVLPDSH